MTIYFNLASIVEVEKSKIAGHLVSALNYLGREVVRFTTHSLIPVAIVVTALAIAAFVISVYKAYFSNPKTNESR